MNAIEHVYSALWDLKKKGAVPHTRDIAPLLDILVSAAQDLHNSITSGLEQVTILDNSDALVKILQSISLFRQLAKEIPPGTFAAIVRSLFRSGDTIAHALPMHQHCAVSSILNLLVRESTVEVITNELTSTIHEHDWGFTKAIINYAFAALILDPQATGDRVAHCFPEISLSVVLQTGNRKTVVQHGVDAIIELVQILEVSHADPPMAERAAGLLGRLYYHQLDAFNERLRVLWDKLCLEGIPLERLSPVLVLLRATMAIPSPVGSTAGSIGSVVFKTACEYVSMETLTAEERQQALAVLVKAFSTVLPIAVLRVLSTAAFRDPSWKVRADCLRAMSEIWLATAEAVGNSDRQAEEEFETSDAFRSIIRVSAEEARRVQASAANHLVRALQFDPHHRVRQTAIEILTSDCTAAEGATLITEAELVPLLQSKIRDRDQKVRSKAFAYLGNIEFSKLLKLVGWSGVGMICRMGLREVSGGSSSEAGTIAEQILLDAVTSGVDGTNPAEVLRKLEVRDALDAFVPVLRRNIGKVVADQ